MKKLFIVLFSAGFLFYFASPLIAGGVDNKTNYSAEYIRTLNRNAATDSADAVAYNPAGVMTMENGYYINVSAHHVSKEYSNIIDGVTQDQDEPSIVPGLFGIYKQDQWALFAAVTIPAGGGKVEFNNGNATTKIGAAGLASQVSAGVAAIASAPAAPPAGFPAAYTIAGVSNERVNAESVYTGLTLGGAYAVNDMVSMSFGARHVGAEKKGRATFQLSPTAFGVGVGQVTRTAVLDYEDTADGWGGILGLNITPEGPFTIGLRYETKTKLEFEYKVNQDSVTGLASGLGAAQGITNGKKHRRDLPAIFGFGIGSQITPKFKIDASLTYYLQDNADWGGAENNVNDGYDAGVSFEYTFNEKTRGSLGYMYTDTGIDAQYMLPENPALSANTLGCGLVYKYTPNLDLNFGIGKVFYKAESYVDTSSFTPAGGTTFGSALNIEFDKDIVFLAFGLQYKF